MAGVTPAVPAAPLPPPADPALPDDALTPGQLAERYEGLAFKVAAHYRPACRPPKDFEGLEQVCRLGVWRAATTWDPARVPVFYPWGHLVASRVAQRYCKLECRRGLTWVGDVGRRVRLAEYPKVHSEVAEVRTGLAGGPDVLPVHNYPAPDAPRRPSWPAGRWDDVLSALPDGRLRDVVRRVALGGESYRALGAEYGVSKERVRQLWNAAVRALRAARPGLADELG